MIISFDIPSSVEKDLRRNVSDVAGVAKEAFLVSLYRQGKMSRRALSQALNLDRFELEEVLRKHNVTEDLGTIEEYLEDVKTLEELRCPRLTGSSDPPRVPRP